ncbi:MAG: DUF5687 family protein [Mediterranea sp.]|jgi:hypothetical protein|nr:DUF5687 family protein [Mediterranea sp.]
MNHLFNLFNELRRHGKLAAKRHPMYEKNRFGKFFMYFMSIFWIGYLIFFGVSFAKLFQELAPNMEPYHILNSGLLFILILDFIMRFPIQKTPTQEIKPYLLLPVKKNRLIDFLLIRSGLSSFNALWLFFIIPFAIFSTIPKYFGISGIITYTIGIYLLMIFNNYGFLLCRTLMRERIWWILLPIVVYALLGVAEFTLDKPVSTFTRDLGEGFIEGKMSAYLIVAFAIAVVWLINRAVMSKLVYIEINKVEDTKIRTISEYKFLERYGEIGEYFRLELKMLFRNKRCKASLRTITILVVVFSAILSFGDVYDGVFMKNFIAIYSFVGIGAVILTQIMGYEGNYLDGLMTRKESIYSLLKAKYYLYSIGVIIPFVLMIPAIVMGKLSLLSAFAFAFFAIGPGYFMLFQLTVYNNKTVPLNEGLTGRQSSGTGFQSLVSFGTFGLPITILFALDAVFGEVIGQWILLSIGLAFVSASHLWIKNVYNRFMKRRYTNMGGFRDTR